MTSRERVQAAVNHQPVDRVPIDLGAMRASGISSVVYHQIKARLGISTPTKVHDPMQILAELEPEFLDHFHVDVLPLEATTADWADADAGKTALLLEGEGLKKAIHRAEAGAGDERVGNIVADAHLPPRRRAAV